MNLSKIVKESISYSEVARKIGYSYVNGTITRKVKKLISNYDHSHFRKGIKCKYKKIKKICPICSKEFEAQEGHNREKQTCSYACSNIHFRSGPDNGNWKEHAYRTICFHHHAHKCICCDEELAIDVHHLDQDKDNNMPENLIPLCPTHHRYWHSRYRHLIEEKVLCYVKKYIKKQERRFA